MWDGPVGRSVSRLVGRSRGQTKVWVEATNLGATNLQVLLSAILLTYFQLFLQYTDISRSLPTYKNLQWIPRIWKIKFKYQYFNMSIQIPKLGSFYTFPFNFPPLAFHGAMASGRALILLQTYLAIPHLQNFAQVVFSEVQSLLEGPSKILQEERHFLLSCVFNN